jgi:hypothetical protein
VECHLAPKVKLKFLHHLRWEEVLKVWRLELIILNNLKAVTSKMIFCICFYPQWGESVEELVEEH